MFVVFLFSQQERCVKFKLSPLVNCFFASFVKFVFLQVYVLLCAFATFSFAKCYFVCLFSNSFW